MSRYRMITAFAVLFSFGFLVAGCGGGGDQKNTTTTQTKDKSKSTATGSLMATVNFDGEEPKPETYDASGNSECGKDQIKSRTVVVNGNGTLKNVVVAVKSGPSLDLPAPDVKITQNECMYKPHVSVAKTGQSITVGDQDPSMHNVRGSMKGGAQLFNLTTFKGQTKSVTIDKAGIVGLQCDVHPWMQGWIYVTENGAASVTGKEGTANLSNLPTGEYTLEFWHEKYGTKTKTVTINKGKKAEVSVTFSG
jgi:plastocyanin